VTTARSDLTGKVAIVAGTDVETILAVIESFARHQVPVAVVAPDREALSRAADWFGAEAVGVVAVTGDPGDPALWQRVTPHAEQRLGPIDIVVLAGEVTMRDLVVNRLLPDMAARRRGVIVELGPDLTARTMPVGVHHHLATNPADAVLAAGSA